jgi:hypothetical protein
VPLSRSRCRRPNPYEERITRRRAPLAQCAAIPRVRGGMCEPGYASRSRRAKAHRNIPTGESDESSAVEATVRDRTHPLFGRTFRIIRSVRPGGGLPLSYEVEYRDGASLLVPVAATEPQVSQENRTKLCVEALDDLTLAVEQCDADRSERPVGNAAGHPAAPDRRRGRRNTGGGKP